MSMYTCIFSLCMLVARTGDALAQRVFREAGELLGAHVKALAPRAEASLTAGGLHVVAVGSVLTYCWDLLREGRPQYCHAVSH